MVKGSAWVAVVPLLLEGCQFNDLWKASCSAFKSIIHGAWGLCFWRGCGGLVNMRGSRGKTLCHVERVNIALFHQGIVDGDMREGDWWAPCLVLCLGIDAVFASDKQLVTTYPRVWLQG